MEEKTAGSDLGSLVFYSLYDATAPHAYRVLRTIAHLLTLAPPRNHDRLRNAGLWPPADLRFVNIFGSLTPQQPLIPQPFVPAPSSGG